MSVYVVLGLKSLSTLRGYDSWFPTVQDVFRCAEEPGNVYFFLLYSCCNVVL